IISAAFNFTLAITLIIREKKNPEFNEWFKKNGLTAEVITSLSIADVEILSFLNSNFAGSPRFAAHFSEDTEEWLSAASWVNLFIQDISQFAIQVIYLCYSKKKKNFLSLLIYNYFFLCSLYTPPKSFRGALFHLLH